MILNISYENNNQTLECSPKENQTLFDLFDEQGVYLPHGCLSGSCGACLVEITEGTNYLQKPQEMELNTLERSKPEDLEIVQKKDKNQTCFRLSCKTKFKLEESFDEAKNIKEKKISFKTRDL